MRVFGLALWCCCLLVLPSGCGGDPLGRQAVSGSVSFNGAPVDTGTVSFHPLDSGAATMSGGSIIGGKYALESDKGLAPGKYRVSINAPKPGTGGQVVEGAMPGDPVAPPQELIPPEWNTKSEQYIEVKSSGTNEFNFEVNSKGK